VPTGNHLLGQLLAAGSADKTDSKRSAGGATPAAHSLRATTRRHCDTAAGILQAPAKVNRVSTGMATDLLDKGGRRFMRHPLEPLGSSVIMQPRNPARTPRSRPRRHVVLRSHGGTVRYGALPQVNLEVRQGLR
jgi:hypothetical protein